MSFLSAHPSPPRASRNISHVFPDAPSCFDTSARELCGEGRGRRTQRLTSGLGWPAGCRLPWGCRHHFVCPSAALRATIDQLTERFAVAALDGPSEKLIVASSQQIKPHQLVSWSHQWASWLPFLITLAWWPRHGSEREREIRRKTERERRGLKWHSFPQRGVLS